MQQITIPLSKRNVSFMLTIAIMFVLLGLWMLNLDAAEIESHRRYNSPLFVHGAGLATIIFFGAALIAATRKLFDPAPGLVLSEEGLTDNTSLLPAGFVPWSDISGFSIGRIKNQRFLYVLLKDQDAYIDKCGQSRRALLRANRPIALSPVTITSNSLAIKFDELESIVTKYFAARRQDV